MVGLNYVAHINEVSYLYTKESLTLTFIKTNGTSPSLRETLILSILNRSVRSSYDSSVADSVLQGKEPERYQTT